MVVSPPVLLIKKKFHVARVDCAYDLKAADSILATMTAKCEEGWEPIGMTLLPSEDNKYKVSLFFKTFCTASGAVKCLLCNKVT